MLSSPNQAAGGLPASRSPTPHSAILLAVEAASHPHYTHYTSDQIRRLDGFYGRVDARFNERIATHVVGRRVLDFGSGFGSLVDHLKRSGFEATGIDLHESQVFAGRERFQDLDLRIVTPGPLEFSDDEFDTVIFKDSLHHVAAEIDVDAALNEVSRICSQRLIIFEPNPSIPLKIGRTLIGHVDPTLPPDAARALVERTAFQVKSVQYLASLAFPLSGGYVGKPLLPQQAPEGIFRLDERVVRLLGPGVAWRYLMVADKRP